MTKRIKGHEVELLTAARLHQLTYRALNLDPGNRWQYPTIHDWDWNEVTPDWDIPAYISFILWPDRHLSFQAKQSLEQHVRQSTNTRYEFAWKYEEFTLWAIRRHINYRYEYFYPQNFEVPKHEISVWYSTLEWAAVTRRWYLASQNGGVTSQ